MDLLQEDAQKLARQLARHDRLYRQVYNLRRELGPRAESLLARKRQELNTLEQVETELNLLGREGVINKFLRSAKEILHGGMSRRDELEARRLRIVERLNAFGFEQTILTKRYRELVDREEALLLELYGDQNTMTWTARWVLGAGAVVAAVCLGFAAFQLFWGSIALAAAAGAVLTHDAQRHRADRIFGTEEELWRRIRSHHDTYRERIVSELDSVGVLLKEFREPVADAVVKAETTNTEFFKAATSFLMELARRDGKIVPEELEAIQSILEMEFGLTYSALEELQDFVKQETDRTLPVPMKQLMEHFRHPAESRLLLRLLFRVAFSDSRFYGREETLIEYVRQNIGVDQDQLLAIRKEEEILAQARGIGLPPMDLIHPARVEPVPADVLHLDDETEVEGRDPVRRRVR